MAVAEYQRTLFYETGVHSGRQGQSFGHISGRSDGCWVRVGAETTWLLLLAIDDVQDAVAVEAHGLAVHSFCAWL